MHLYILKQHINRNSNRFFMSKRSSTPHSGPVNKRPIMESPPESGPSGMARPKIFTPISETDQRILIKAKNFLLTSLDESYLVSPTALLSERKCTDAKISASHLTIGPGTNTYFIEKKLTTALNGDNDKVPSLTGLQEFLEKEFKESMMEIPTLISPQFYVCQSKILTKLGRCGSKIRNEAELCYAIGDPIMEMFHFWSPSKTLYIV